MSQAQLAAHLGNLLNRKYDATTITRLEKGTRPTSLDEADVLAGLLGSTLEKMLQPVRNVEVESRLRIAWDNYRAVRYRLVQTAERCDEVVAELDDLIAEARSRGLEAPHVDDMTWRPQSAVETLKARTESARE